MIITGFLSFSFYSYGDTVYAIISGAISLLLFISFFRNIWCQYHVKTKTKAKEVI